MKRELGWWFPDHETHLPEWMQSPKGKLEINDRWSYQGRKQLQALNLVQRTRTAVDVGGHVGLWSYNLSHWFDIVHAFEPVKAHRECFVKNVLEAQDAGPATVHLHPFGLSNAEGLAHAVEDPHSTGGTHLRMGGDIPLRTLDSFGLGDVDLIKIDVEGMELAVVQGAVETIRRCKPLLVIEQKGKESQNLGRSNGEALDYLRHLGMREVAPSMAGDHFMGWN